MHLTPREQERLLLAAGADLARRRLARGARLGAAEVIALLSDEILEWAWDGVEYDEIVRRAGELVPRSALLPGVAALVPVVQVEALFPHGTVLVHVPDPLGPRPDASGAAEAPAAVETEGAAQSGAGREGAQTEAVGEGAAAPTFVSVLPGRERVDLAAGKRRGSARVQHVGHAPIWVSSHMPLRGLNAALQIELPAEPEGGIWRLDLPAGMSRRFDPGERTEVGVVLTTRTQGAR